MNALCLQVPRGSALHTVQVTAAWVGPAHARCPLSHAPLCLCRCCWHCLGRLLLFP